MSLSTRLSAAFFVGLTRLPSNISDGLYEVVEVVNKNWPRL
ncbi:hypothetical protein [Yersinia bercovieri]|nr:hypothetical protein [Yersinia bercovieri]